VSEALAYSTVAVTVALAVSRPRLGFRGLRVTVGAAAAFGVLVLLVGGLLTPTDLWTSAAIQWRPLLTLTCIMVMTGVVKEVAAFERLARHVEAHARATSPVRAFDLIFVASVVTPSLLNNDAAILLLTPVVVAISRSLYPGNTKILEAFVFAVFLAPGVAPFVISNPMNMIVAEYAGIGFNAYAQVMFPISVVGAVATYVVLRFLHRDVLRTAKATASEPAQIPPPHPAERPALGFLLAVFFAYPVMAALGGPMWVVALAGAVGCVLIAWRHRVASPRRLVGHVSFDILVFLWGVFLVVAGLRQVGVVDRLAAFYAAYDGALGAHVAVIGTTSALGSALVDNHPMSILNMMALGQEGTSTPLLAALIGGDIGPRLLPIGSLAGLLWIDLLRRRGIEIGVWRFLRLGTLILAPTLTLSLVMLWLMAG
jgi:arsenical pump membrane protein